MTLQRYLTRVIWLCAGPPMLAALALSVLHVHQLQDDRERQASNLAQQVGVAIDHKLRAALDSLQGLAAFPELERPEHWPRFYEQAQGYARTFGTHVILAAPGPRMLLHTRAALGDPLPAFPLGIGRLATAAALAEAKPAVGDLVPRPPLAEEPAIGAAVPVLRGGTAALAVATAMPVHQFERLLHTATLPAGWSLTLRDSRGERVAARALAAADPQGKPPAGAWAERYVAALTAAPWSVVLEISPEAHRAPLLEAAGVLALALLGTAALALTAGQLASRRVARAVHSLADSAPATLRTACTPRGEADIAEVAEVRRRLGEAFSARAHAEAERAATERAAREQLERAAIELRVSQGRLAGVFDSVAEAILTTDGAHRIVMANPAAARMLGCPLPDLVGQPIMRFVPERYRERYLEAAQGLARRDGAAAPPPRRAGMHGQRADGSEFPIEAAMSHVHVDGQRLFTLVVRDVTEPQRAEAALRDNLAELARAREEVERSHAALQRLLAAQDSVQERERRRIAMELHDELQQTLAAIQMDAAAGRQTLAKNPDEAAVLYTRIEELAGAGIAATRRIVNDLRPRFLEDLGLVPALEALAALFAERCGIACTVRATGTLAAAANGEVSPDAATCLYRAAQESLNNVVKHSGASSVRIAVHGFDDGRLRLRVTDNGRGMLEADRRKPDSFGLLGMRERVRALGGDLQLRTTPGGGVTVEVRLPAA